MYFAQHDITKTFKLSQAAGIWIIQKDELFYSIITLISLKINKHQKRTRQLQGRLADKFIRGINILPDTAVKV